MSDWQTMKMPFGKHKGKTFAEIKRVESHYLRWLYDTLKEGDKLKIAAGEALGYIEKEEKPKTVTGESYFKIGHAHSEKFHFGMMAIEFSEDYRESFLELHPCCREWDEKNGVWLVPLAFFDHILERFPKVKLCERLWLIRKWDKKRYKKPTKE